MTRVRNDPPAHTPIAPENLEKSLELECKAHQITIEQRVDACKQLQEVRQSREQADVAIQNLPADIRDRFKPGTRLRNTCYGDYMTIHGYEDGKVLLSNSPDSGPRTAFPYIDLLQVFEVAPETPGPRPQPHAGRGHAGRRDRALPRRRHPMALITWYNRQRPG